MKIREGDVALVTGASRGLGVHIAQALAGRGMRLVLAARSAPSLEEVAQGLRQRGADVLCVPADLGDARALQALVHAGERHFGRIDVLVNNAGADHSLAFDRCSVEHIAQMLAVNLNAPVLLARLVLPGMLAQGRGHIVNIASIAGLMASPYEELYVAAKHGLVGFTRALRASAQDMGWPVGASVICPGFMHGAGMYETMRREHGIRAPRALGSLPAARLGDATLRVIERDLPDLVLMRGWPRLIAALLVMAPRVYEVLARKSGTGDVFRTVAAAHAARRDAQAPPT